MWYLIVSIPDLCTLTNFSDLDCIPFGNQLTPECINKLAGAQVPPCEMGYQLTDIDGTSECILQITDEDCGKKYNLRKLKKKQ